LGFPIGAVRDSLAVGFGRGKSDEQAARRPPERPVLNEVEGRPTRLVAGLLILKHMHSLSDEALCARWIENPYYQYFCEEVDRANAVLAAAGYNFGLLIRWFETLRLRSGQALLRALFVALLRTVPQTRFA
jgi:hypothetical protein